MYNQADYTVVKSTYSYKLSLGSKNIEGTIDANDTFVAFSHLQRAYPCAVDLVLYADYEIKPAKTIDYVQFRPTWAKNDKNNQF